MEYIDKIYSMIDQGNKELPQYNYSLSLVIRNFYRKLDSAYIYKVGSVLTRESSMSKFKVVGHVGDFYVVEETLPKKLYTRAMLESKFEEVKQ